MLETVHLIFETKNLLVGIATYLKIVENVEVKIDKLISKEFDSAMALLNQASCVNDYSIRNSLLINTIDRFNQAIRLEKRERLLLSYLGLMMCYYHVGERNAACNLQKEFQVVEFDESFWDKHGPAIERGFGLLMGAAALLSGTSSGVAVKGGKIGEDLAVDTRKEIEERKRKFTHLKDQILSIKF